MRTPLDGDHRVSGNRQWGIKYDNNLQKTVFYTSGVNRVTNIGPAIINDLTNVGFNAADELWSGLQTKMANFINEHGGSASVNLPTKYRPDYGYLQMLFKGQMTLQVFKTLGGCQ